MNGIVVMDCVQSAYQGNYGLYGAQDRMIRISGRSAAAVPGTCSLSHEDTGKRRKQLENGSGFKGGSSRKNGLKRFAENNRGRMSAGRKSKDICHKAAVTAVEDAKISSAKKDIWSDAVSAVRREQKSASVLRALRLLVLAAVMVCMITGFHMITRASGRPRQQAWKYHTTVTIPYGESFSDLVERTFNSTYYASKEDYLKEICEINSLPFYRGEMPDLQAGTSLVIPYYSTEYK